MQTMNSNNSFIIPSMELPKFVDKQKAQERYNICKSCEFFNTSLYTCKQCGCLMKLKVKFAGQKCPVDKWDIVE